MLALGSLAFAAPWLLVGLLSLPILWWLLRVTPPAPRRLRFPAIRLLLGLVPKEETPAKTPLWLILLRMALAALIICALAHPLLNPAARLGGNGPLVLLIDNGWAAAKDWPARQTAIKDMIAQAEREDRRVVLVPTAPAAGDEAGRPLSLARAADARAAAQHIQPSPWPVDRKAALARLEALAPSGTVDVVWISDGLDDGEATALAERLQRFGSLRFLSEEGSGLARLVAPPERENADLTVAVRRATGGQEQQVSVRVTGDDGRLLAREPAHLAAGARSTDVRLAMPSELRNRAMRVEIEGESTAGAVMLLDERWRRRPVGIADIRPTAAAQPLLSGTYYLERALNPFSEVRHGRADELLKREIAVMILADAAPSSKAERDALVGWMEKGGVVLRFAGPDLAENGDDLLPVTLRRGGRTLGGALSWEQPAHLAPFTADSPFAGLPIPDDVTVSRQVLAEPSLDLGSKTWARLTDGTPLVTAERRGQGWLVLVHTTGSPEWSNLSLSGLFVEMLRRVVGMSQGVAAASEGLLPPLETLDGQGHLQRAAATARPIQAGAFGETAVSAAHPPGFYGTADARRALNLSGRVKKLAAIENLPAGVARETYARGGEIDLRPWLLAGALLLGLIDLVIAYALRGLLGFAAPTLRRGAAAGALLLALALPAGGGRAQTDDDFVVKATAEIRLAYVRTGVPEVDEVSRAGLVGLTQTLTRRTAVEAADPLEVDIEADELVFFPLIYWAVTPEQRPPSPQAVERLNRFLATGGTILFDTRDQGERGPGAYAGGSGTERLRQLVRGLKIPSLQPIQPDHVLTKAFYLMQEFPGRWTGGGLWIEPTTDRINDGVATVMIGSNDYAGAWAVDGQGRPAFPVVPGGEAQREQAYRFGVNLVMYALTGNYKTDQVHVPAILERLGQ
jgi:hypothetical protein